MLGLPGGLIFVEFSKDEVDKFFVARRWQTRLRKLKTKKLRKLSEAQERRSAFNLWIAFVATR